MDPVHPIAPGPSIFPQAGPEPVQRLDRVTREQRREQREQQRRRRAASPDAAEPDDQPEDEDHPHIDVQA
jgi:hypothetical protein